MAIRIAIRSKEKDIYNTSLQIGDMLYYVGSITNPSNIRKSSSLPEKIGKLTSIDGDLLRVQNNINVNTPVSNDFLMFSKNKLVNNTSLVGYYAEVTLTNNSTEKAELFSLGSEITISSK